MEALVRTTEAAMGAEVNFWVEKVGMRMLSIYPADNPRQAMFSGLGMRLRVVAARSDDETGRDEGDDEVGATAVTTLRVPRSAHEFRDDARVLLSPGGGARVLIVDDAYEEMESGELVPPTVPATKHVLSIQRLRNPTTQGEQSRWFVGRAGMEYRDLIPDRLGGAVIASHIRIPGGGPVKDNVHFHNIRFQMIYCVRGWVDLVYEDQGEQFRLTAGSLVTQPPEIRHRVLESSDDLEVLEVVLPAEHMTYIDHEMTLPNDKEANPDREFRGQRFVHYTPDDDEESGDVWAPFRLPGFIATETGVRRATNNLASVHRVQPNVRVAANGTPAAWTKHFCDVLLTFVVRGSMTLETEKGYENAILEAGDAFVTPPGLATRYLPRTKSGNDDDENGENDTDGDESLELLEIALPGKFDTDLLLLNGIFNSWF